MLINNKEMYNSNFFLQRYTKGSWSFRIKSPLNFNKWLLQRGKPSKVNMPELKEKLLYPALGFSTNEPLPGSHTPSVAATHPASRELNLNGKFAVN